MLFLCLSPFPPIVFIKACKRVFNWFRPSPQPWHNVCNLFDAFISTFLSPRWTYDFYNVLTDALQNVIIFASRHFHSRLIGKFYGSACVCDGDGDVKKAVKTRWHLWTREEGLCAGLLKPFSTHQAPCSLWILRRLFRLLLRRKAIEMLLFSVNRFNTDSERKEPNAEECVMRIHHGWAGAGILIQIPCNMKN